MPIVMPHIMPAANSSHKISDYCTSFRAALNRCLPSSTLSLVPGLNVLASSWVASISVAAAGWIVPVLVLLMRREAEVATRKDRRLLLVAERTDRDDSAEASRPTRIGSRGTSSEPGAKAKADEPPLEQRQRIKGRVDVARMVAFLNAKDDMTSFSLSSSVRGKEPTHEVRQTETKPPDTERK